MAFEAIKLCGAAYLGLLGVLALRASFRGPSDAPGDAERIGRAWSRIPRLTHPYMQGLLTNVTNPKAIAFFLTFLPQFLGTGQDAVPKALALAVIPVVLSLSWLTLYVVLIGRVAAVLRRPAVQRWQERVLGCVFLGFGAQLAAEHL